MHSATLGRSRPSAEVPQDVEDELDDRLPTASACRAGGRGDRHRPAPSCRARSRRRDVAAHARAGRWGCRSGSRRSRCGEVVEGDDQSASWSAARRIWRRRCRGPSSRRLNLGGSSALGQHRLVSDGRSPSAPRSPGIPLPSAGERSEFQLPVPCRVDAVHCRRQVIANEFPTDRRGPSPNIVATPWPGPHRGRGRRCRGRAAAKYCMRTADSADRP
jgi:hypothetical protein